MSQALLMLTALGYPGLEKVDVSEQQTIRQIVSWLESRKVVTFFTKGLQVTPAGASVDFKQFCQRSGSTNQSRGKA